MEVEPTYHQIRQNPYGKTNQSEMRDCILDTCILSCPFGHIGECRGKIMDKTYNIEAKGQDKYFCEDLNIGDIIVIVFKIDGSDKKYNQVSLRNCIVARIISKPIDLAETNHFISNSTNKKINISKIKTKGSLPFRPIGRRIEIIESNLELIGDRKKYFSMKSIMPLFDTTKQKISL